MGRPFDPFTVFEPWYRRALRRGYEGEPYEQTPRPDMHHLVSFQTPDLPPIPMTYTAKKYRTGTEDAFSAMLRQARVPGASCSDLDGLWWRDTEQGAKMLAIIEAKAAREPERALQGIAEALQAGHSRMQGRLLRHMACVHGCPALVVVYREGAKLAPCEPLWLLRLDTGGAAQRWRKTTVEVFHRRLRTM